MGVRDVREERQRGGRCALLARIGVVRRDVSDRVIVARSGKIKKTGRHEPFGKQVWLFPALPKFARMTEYDYSPDAWDRYIATQQRIADWVDGTLQQAPCNAFAPATPHLQALALKEQERRRQVLDDHRDDSSRAESDDYSRHRRHRSSHHRSHRRDDKKYSSSSSRYKDADIDDYVIIDPPPSSTSSRTRATSLAPNSKSSRSRRPTHLTIDLNATPFPTSGAPYDPYSYRNSGHSSHSSNTTTPTNVTPNQTVFPFHQVQPYSAPAVTGRAPVLGGTPPKPSRSHTMPHSPHYYVYPTDKNVYPGMSSMGHQPVMVPLRKGGYASYGPDPSQNHHHF
ncbi:hypothetical protein FA15DRAFT_653668 [Coprinopsis marcescibilis]|uniref:Uncharacterized protein n=1 Tax=Coprinopsis marcescibilis TaxID=230819 RepID=A0A5C3L331_COPMA|nr:hypothetical protein FA15DRAFT_653668 [Coprinopsis marcescibilis]